jgi:hypothetical protein
MDEHLHKMVLPMHLGGGYHHDLPVPEHHHFRPMSHYQEHPYYAQQNRSFNAVLPLYLQ